MESPLEHPDPTTLRARNGSWTLVDDYTHTVSLLPPSDKESFEGGGLTPGPDRLNPTARNREPRAHRRTPSPRRRDAADSGPASAVPLPSPAWDALHSTLSLAADAADRLAKDPSAVERTSARIVQLLRGAEAAASEAQAQVAAVQRNQEVSFCPLPRCFETTSAENASTVASHIFFFA